MTEFELLSAINGADEEGNPKTSCTLALVNIYPNGDAETIDTYTSLYTYVYTDIKATKLLSAHSMGDISTIKVLFNDTEDNAFEYNQFLNLCNKKFLMSEEIDDVNAPIPALVLYITPLSDFTTQLMAIDCSYTVIPITDNISAGIQFVVSTENIVFNEVPEEFIDEIIGNTVNDIEAEGLLYNYEDEYADDYMDEEEADKEIDEDTIHKFY